MGEVLSLRPSGELEKQLKKLSKMQGVARPALARKLLLIGAKEELKNQAIELFRGKKVSLGKASEIAGISIMEMLGLVKKEGLLLNVGKKSVEADLRKAIEARF